ncbi:hypothetical protein DK842_19385 [Chromobacterium phragmitis]|uniref:hypothetical protein n=1 Tax=Chromobacterium phragmitis TaxID=2202141 RepID=UPI000DEC812D|nr:hypothetical protein [Chromobacterium phragmitis]AXE31870.1 hypothetical protein DK842_19385 [Chromobacterium phragmitis]
MLNPIAAANPAAAASSGGEVLPLSQRLAAHAASEAQVQAFLQAARDVPQAIDDTPQARRDHIAALSRLLREFVDNGQIAFPDLASQLDAIGQALKAEGKDSPLHASLMGVMVGLNNLQYQTEKWMQEVMLSDGAPQEFESW